MPLNSAGSLPFLLLLASVAMAGPIRVENRCGWYDNPTPGNAWIHDKDGEWIIASEGEYEAKGNWIPEFNLDDDKKFVLTGSSYGYGCVCMKVETDFSNKRITKVSAIRIKNLADCRQDKSLIEPGSTAKAEVGKCQKQAEAIARDFSRKKRKVSESFLQGTGNPTEMKGKNYVVYIGGHAGYDYFELQLDDKCQLLKVVDSEYSP